MTTSDRPSRPVLEPDDPHRPSPSPAPLSVVVLAGEDTKLSDAVRTVLLAPPPQITHRVVVAHRPDLALAADSDIVVVDDAASPGARRNRGHMALGELTGAVAFLEADAALSSDWLTRSTEALGADGDTGVCGELGSWVQPGVPLPTGSANAGSVVVVSAHCLAQVGSFDEELESAHAVTVDLCRRAARVGYRPRQISLLATSTPTVGRTWPEADVIRLGERRVRQVLGADTPFLVLADANEATATTAILAGFYGAFRGEEEVALILFGPGLDPPAYELALLATAEAAGVNVDSGPRVLAICPPRATPEDYRRISDEVFALLTAAPAPPAYATLARFGPADTDALRALAARVWAARPPRPAT